MIAAATAAALLVGVATTAAASGSTRSIGAPRSRSASCAPVAPAPPGGTGYLASLTQACLVASTKPANGDLNPYGVAVVPRTVGSLVAGDVLVSNFNNSHNLQGTGSTIVEISPAGSAKLFAHIAPAGVHIGLTTALAVFRNGDVVVGSLPTTNGMPATATAGDLFVLNSTGQLIETIKGANVNGPWDLASYDGGGFGVLFVANVLNGTVAAGGKVVNKGDVVRFVLDLTKNPPAVVQQVVIAGGLAEKTDPSALVIGPTGLAMGANGTVYVADTFHSYIRAIPDGLFAGPSNSPGTVISHGSFLVGPLGLTIAPNGNLISVNAGNAQMVESTVKGAQPEWPTVDSGGAGVLFGLAVQPGGKGIYFVNDGNNTLEIFK